MSKCSSLKSIGLKLVWENYLAAKMHPTTLESGRTPDPIAPTKVWMIFLKKGGPHFDGDPIISSMGTLEQELVKVPIRRQCYAGPGARAQHGTLRRKQKSIIFAGLGEWCLQYKN